MELMAFIAIKKGPRSSGRAAFSKRIRASNLLCSSSMNLRRLFNGTGKPLNNQVVHFDQFLIAH